MMVMLGLVIGWGAGVSAAWALTAAGLVGAGNVAAGIACGVLGNIAGLAGGLALGRRRKRIRSRLQARQHHGDAYPR